MNITYKIRSFDAVNGSIVVEFQDFTPFNIDLPIKEGNYIEGEELDTYIKGFLPLEFVQRKQTIANGIINEQTIAALVEPYLEPVESTPPQV